VKGGWKKQKTKKRGRGETSGLVNVGWFCSSISWSRRKVVVQKNIREQQSTPEKGGGRYKRLNGKFCLEDGPAFT